MNTDVRRINGNARLSRSEELMQMICRHAPSDGTYDSAVPSLRFRHAVRPMKPELSFAHSSLYIIAQGSKTVTLSGQDYRYNPLYCLVNPIHLPVTGSIDEASPELPYLSVQLEFSVDDIQNLLQDFVLIPAAESQSALFVNAVTSELLDAMLRLIRLLDCPEDIPVLAPLAIREILYRVLQSEQGPLIARFALDSSRPNRIAQAADRIKRDYALSLNVRQLADEAHMSPASLHKHFKRLTGMSPIQYQKTLRLQAARHLMFVSDLEAAEAAFRVGYESPSQFSREYARMFGLPPKKEIKRRLDGNVD
ncbi:AraC family transcriptional regulator [Saccharibacillus alkalitolerans]|uniref:AraC family transcriptional regulator n=1 Tax=Saccharibacillus alkalitolerans TaxID=2705290 RepID=A0ABX0F0T2_9BACL|nr:AraC family transcriptional regulator [Saccharibacillus alkalitolerans]NGZ74588.1 AraC family transcriptional regulator [Saccharibacillus alkalitolerans]